MGQQKGKPATAYASEQLGKHRWVVDRTREWFVGFGRLRIRFARRGEYPRNAMNAGSGGHLRTFRG